MELSDFFAQHPKAALAFSGGADSSFLLYSAAACGADIMPYYVRSQFQPAFERADACRLAAALGVPLRELELVVRGGVRIERPQIKKMPDVERELDKCL